MSEVDQVPGGWNKRRLRFDVHLNPLKSKLALPDNTEVSFVPMDAVGELGGLASNETRLIEEVYSGYTYFANGDIVVAKITPCFENGKGALAKGLTNGVAFGTTELHVIRPQSGLDAQFLFYMTIAQDFRSFGEAEMLGAGGQKRVPEEFLKDWRAPLPPFETQRRIAQFLDEKTTQIDGLIEKKRKLLDCLEEKRLALITRAVTKGLSPAVPMKNSNIDWLGNIPAHWDLAALGYRYEVQLGRMLNAERASGEDLKPYLRVFDVQWGKINTENLPLMDFPPDAQERYLLRSGDLLVNEGGSYVGRSAIWRGEIEECYYQKALHRLRPLRTNQDNAEFFYFVMEAATKNAVFVVGGNQTTIDHLTAEQLKHYRFGFPPLEEQLSIATTLKRALLEQEDLVCRIELSIQRLQMYRSAIVTAAVTGKMPATT